MNSWGDTRGIYIPTRMLKQEAVYGGTLELRLIAIGIQVHLHVCLQHYWWQVCVLTVAVPQRLNGNISCADISPAHIDVKQFV